MTAELALLLGAAFGQSPRFWLAQQADYDTAVAKASMGAEAGSMFCIEHVVSLLYNSERQGLKPIDTPDP